MGNVRFYLFLASASLLIHGRGTYGHDQDQEHLGGDLHTDDCPATDYHFKDGGYIEHLPEIPDLVEATICFFVEINNKGDTEGAVASYGTAENAKLLAVVIESRSLRVTVDGKTRRIPIPLGDSREHHICIIASTADGKITRHVDAGKPVVVNIPKLKPLPGGGTLLVGKSQDDSDLTFTGQIRDFRMWDRAIGSDEIKKVRRHLCTGDEIATLAPEDVIFNGDFVEKEECPHGDYILNNRGDSEEYLEILSPQPDMKYTTSCSWMTTDDKGVLPGTVGSYVVGDDVDMLIVEGVTVGGEASIRTGVNGDIAIMKSNFKPSTEYFNCIQHYIPRKESRPHINGRLAGVVRYKEIGPVLKGGGKVILGQRQGCRGGCFDKKRAYNGRIRNFAVWDRILSE